METVILTSQRDIVVGKGHILVRDPSLVELADLAPDWEAERTSVGGEWTRDACPPEVKAVLQGINDLGATLEGLNSCYLAIDIPPDVELEKVADYLIRHDVRWEHADPRYSDLYPGP